MKRGRKGGTLGFVVASAITLILLAICFFFVTQLIGGGREHVNAIDAACLNVAKQALVAPRTTLAGPVELQNFGALGDDDRGRARGNIINLRNYNRLFGQAALVAINANADPTTTATTNANRLIDALQTGPGSIGGRLTEELKKTSGNVLFQHTDIAGNNSVRMLGNNSTVTHIESEYRTAYLEQDRGRDPQATNLELPPAAGIGAVEPANSVRSLFASQGLVTTVDGRDYVRGYEPVTAGALVRLVGVPVPPRRQPHLVSRVDFERQTSQFADISHAAVPPNGVKTFSKANAEVARTDTTAASWAVVGSTNPDSLPSLKTPEVPGGRNYFPSIPRGYIEVVNAGETSVSPIPGDNTWIQNQGNPAVGTRVVDIPGKQIFGDPPIVAAWNTYNAAVAANPATAGPPPSTNAAGLFIRNGNTSSPASFADARAINNLGTRCTDGNVGSGTCNQLWNNGNGAFDHAYYPGGRGTAPGTGTGLTAVECADCQVEKMFNQETSLSINTGQPGSVTCAQTGLRIFNQNCDGNMQTSPKGNCVSTRPGTIRELGNYISRSSGAYTSPPNGTYGNQMIDYIVGRCRQICPSATQAEIDAFVGVLDTTVIRPGTQFYIYAPEVFNADGEPIKGAANPFVISTTRPPGYTGAAPDGTVLGGGSGPSVSYSIQRGGQCGIMNPDNDFGIHAVMYRNDATANFTGTDSGKLTRSSGYDNMLGRIEFSNSVTGSCALFSEPD